MITNIDHEHMESYGTWENLQQAFVGLREQGAVLRRGRRVRRTTRRVRAMLPKITRRVITYGVETRATAPRRYRHVMSSSRRSDRAP